MRAPAAPHLQPLDLILQADGRFFTWVYYYIDEAVGKERARRLRKSLSCTRTYTFVARHTGWPGLDVRVFCCVYIYDTRSNGVLVTCRREWIRGSLHLCDACRVKHIVGRGTRGMRRGLLLQSKQSTPGRRQNVDIFVPGTSYETSTRMHRLGDVRAL